MFPSVFDIFRARESNCVEDSFVNPRVLFDVWNRPTGHCNDMEETFRAWCIKQEPW
jgi:hypothetical protein